ncbi:methionine synthase (B12-independent) [Rhodothalassium salexigens DSM 2132]|uniref:5-methyltetrahydropteroyltriglutamate--homocysteine methyltransferase n=1 Tax=Rhodothalassium salexigens DSM 2132 TaxID=1188247 RepID=A0A4V2SQ76_RHOSA|nr:5-methyltetrahydropteroyltriglutamate--homocysteine S-methyltransferase [Rhodothalassium salexigens]MBB4210537.1 5-methyltetrahydropteroyltriglutamate--homocysteine methyltransferase [Rhodothalassium salexigens DSM 2132]MBK1638054.1 5-methyltetrahydropteroyltriglutamate--homocysteine S-methyltransferase [Rhodothalassium salexigens DSM 2132]TCP37906.1 methionine synthase (B12-independent) [Rhodothalassium salexigens DSM 2132]
MVRSANLGFPRIGARRELKHAVEAYWKGECSADRLKAIGAELRTRHWQLQQDAGIDVIPSNDFSFYDQMLDMAVTLGAVPPRFAALADADPLDLRFAMARGTDDAPAMEMTKWFDTNYHYIVPEVSADQRFELRDPKPVAEVREARALGIQTRPVLIGPITFLMLSKAQDGTAPLSLLGRLLPIYRQLLNRLADEGAEWVQVDEPVLALDLPASAQDALRTAYAALADERPALMLTSYFEGLGDNLALAAGLPVAGLHLDLVRGAQDLTPALTLVDRDRVLSLGLIDGRNIWRANLRDTLKTLQVAIAARGPERLQVAPSCSLLHCPVDLTRETELDAELRGWLAFAKQKLEEVAVLARAAHGTSTAIEDALDDAHMAATRRRTSARTHDRAVADRLASVQTRDMERRSPFAERRVKQQARFDLPPFPTTTIGSFPQTREVRKARAAHRRGDMDDAAYEAFLKAETERTIRAQEDLGLDVLVHGEFERNDMVEYFGEQLNGFAFTRAGWVQSYGTRCVKPPIIYGDVSRPAPMTVAWSRYAQSLTDRPVKGMLTGPVTILQWSFVRDDQPRSATCFQIALAIRDEVADLEAAGIGMIQIDEPALREGLPLRTADRAAYLDWAVDAFRLAAAPVADATQIHTHMCYAEFNDIMDAIAGLDADVISIETSRSHMALLDAFAVFAYPNDIGPGVWDIHSPRVPSSDEMVALLTKASAAIPRDRLWVNPDCGLKTRAWPEVAAALKAMVSAARSLRHAKAA